MKRNERSKAAAAIIGAALGAVLMALSSPTRAADVPPASAPGAAQPARSREEIVRDYQQVSAELDNLTGTKVLSNPKQLAEVGQKAIPVLNRQLHILDELFSAHMVGAEQLRSLRVNPTAMLYLLKDAPTIARVDQDASSTDVQRQLGGQTVVLYSRWLSADKSQAAKVVDDLEKLDRAHPESNDLSMLTATFAQTAPTPEISKHAGTLLTDVMTSPIARRIVAQQKQQEEAEAAKKAMLDKPFSVVGKTVQGADFTSESLKGKVVMVDFWATWCGPCKASLPHIKEVYGKYHPQGLEIVGISNDYAAKDLLEFTPQNNMPWTQLFDPAAAAEHRWHPLSEKNGVDGIPCLFLIDKKGVLRSVTAEENMDTMIPKLLAE